jgi:hypothetical protein
MVTSIKILLTFYNSFIFFNFFTYFIIIDFLYFEMNEIRAYKIPDHTQP